MELSDKLWQLYEAGYTRADVARLTHQTIETVALWEQGLELSGSDARLPLLLTVKLSEFKAFFEQRRAIDALLSKGLSRAEIARLVGVTPNSLRMWDKAIKLARGRLRERLLSYAQMPREQFPSHIFDKGARRGRLSQREMEDRVTAMKEAGLWPLSECARNLQSLIEAAAHKNVTATELMSMLGVSRRSFYSYLSPDNSRLLPVETTERYRTLRFTLGMNPNFGNAEQTTTLSLEERFAQASIILFEEYYYMGFAIRDPIKEHTLKSLSRVTGFHERTLRRYLPLRADPQCRVPRVIVEALEEAARGFGSLVRAVY